MNDNKKHQAGIYLDHASTTYVDPEVLSVMLPYFTDIYGNPESLHSAGKKAQMAVDNARETIAKILDCQSSEIIFTSGGTESNNLAIMGLCKTFRAAHPNAKNLHCITSKIEHSSVLEVFRQLEKEGWEITYLDVDHEGFVNPDELKSAIKSTTVLVSIIYANNEIGTIQDIARIGEICKEAKIPFHTDACQAAGALNLNVKALNIDMMSINSGKIYGPKGVGALYVKQGTTLSPVTYGGHQENEIRPGTHNVPGIVGLGKALELAQRNKESENERLTKLRDDFINAFLEKVPDSKLNGAQKRRLPNNINLSISRINGQQLLLLLDEQGIYISTGSACNAGINIGSHVLTALKTHPNLIRSSIRITLGKLTTKDDLDYALGKILENVSHIRLHQFKKV